MAKRKRRINIKLPFSNATILSLMAVAVQIVILIVFAFFGKTAGKSLLMFFAVVGVICTIVSACLLVIVLKDMSDKEYSLYGRIIAIILLLVLFLIWLSVYFVGMTFMMH